MWLRRKGDEEVPVIEDVVTVQEQLGSERISLPAQGPKNFPSVSARPL